MNLIAKNIKKYNGMSRHAKAAIWFLICSFLQKGISVITTPIFTRLLTTTEYGQYNVFDSWLKIISVIVSMNIYYGIYTQGLIKFDKERDSFSSSLQGLSLTLVVVWTIVYLALRDFWNNLLGLTTVQMLAMLIIIWATGAFNYWASEQRVTLSYKKLVGVTVLITIFKPCIGVLFVVFADDKVTARILGLALAEVICFTGLFVAQVRKGKVFFSSKNWKYAIGLCVPLVPHYLSQSLLNSADKIMIEKMSGSAEAGIYGLAYSLSMLVTILNTALLQTINPWIYQKIKDKQTADISKVSYLALAIIVISNIFLVALAPEIVYIFAPSSYYEAIWIIPPVAISTFFMFEYSLFADFEFYYEKTKFIATATVISAIFNVVLNYIFIERFGYIAAGYTTLFCYMVYTLGHYFFMKRICKANKIADVYDIKILVGLMLGLFAVCFGLLITYRFPIIRYSIVFCILIVMFIIRDKIIRLLKGLIGIKKR